MSNRKVILTYQQPLSLICFQLQAAIKHSLNIYVVLFFVFTKDFRISHLRYTDRPLHQESQSNEAIGTGPNPFCQCSPPEPDVQKSNWGIRPNPFCRESEGWYEILSWTFFAINFSLCILSVGLNHLKPFLVPWLKLEVDCTLLFFLNLASSFLPVLQ